jgi:hypothetical protein
MIPLTSCKKQTINKLEGKWRLWYLTKQEQNIIDFWEFKKPNILHRQAFYENDSILDTIGFWSIKSEIFEPTELEIKGFGASFDGIYRIDKLNKNFLFITRIKLPSGASSGAFRRYEFTKEK